MTHMTAIVNDSTHLTLQSPIAVPAGARVQITIVTDAPDDYAAQLSAYYATASPEALKEELDLVHALDGCDAALPTETPWW